MAFRSERFWIRARGPYHGSRPPRPPMPTHGTVKREKQYLELVNGISILQLVTGANMELIRG